MDHGYAISSVGNFPPNQQEQQQQKKNGHPTFEVFLQNEAARGDKTKEAAREDKRNEGQRQDPRQRNNECLEERQRRSLYMEETLKYREEKLQLSRRREALEIPLMLTQLNMAIMEKNRMHQEGRHVGLKLYEIDYAPQNSL